MTTANDLLQWVQVRSQPYRHVVGPEARGLRSSCISAARGGMPVVYGISVPGFRSPSAELTAHQFLILSFSFTLFRTAPLHGIMVAPVKKERSPSVDDESDWLEEDDYVEPFAPPAPAKRPLGGNGSTQLPSKKRKSEGGAASTADGVKGDSSHQYRQPSFTHLPAVRQHSLWRVNQLSFPSGRYDLLGADEYRKDASDLRPCRRTTL